MKFDVKLERPQAGLESFVPEFLEDRVKEVPVLDDALSQGDYKTIKELAHKWKGFSEPYGFGYLAELGKQLEINSANSDYDKVLSQINDVKVYLEEKGKNI